MTRHIAFWLLMSSPALGANAALYDAIRLHQEGEFDRARDALQRLEADPQLSEDDRVTSAEYLASCEMSLKERPGAKAVLKQMLRRHPDARLDPNLFFPEVIALAEEARIELDAERPAAPPLAQVNRPELQRPEPSTRAWVKVPLVAGGVLLVTAAVLESVAYVQYEDLQQAAAPSPGANPAGYQNTGRDFQLAAQISAGVGVAALLVAGGFYVFGSPAAPGHAGIHFEAAPSHLGVSGTF